MCKPLPNNFFDRAISGFCRAIHHSIHKTETTHSEIVYIGKLTDGTFAFNVRTDTHYIYQVCLLRRTCWVFRNGKIHEVFGTPLSNNEPDIDAILRDSNSLVELSSQHAQGDDYALLAKCTAITSVLQQLIIEAQSPAAQMVRFERWLTNA